MRQNNGRKSFCIIDAQSIKNADTAEAMMQARRFQGRIAVDTQACNLYNNSRDIALFTIIRTDRNMLLACYSHKHISYRIRTIIRKAITDRSSAVRMVENAKENLSGVKNVLVDAGYTGENFVTQIKTIIGATVEVIKRNELRSFVVLPKRWVVERSFAWLEKCRRLWKNCERKLNTSLQMVVLAFTALLLKKL